MLEWIATPYGEMVPSFNGNLLASKVNPEKEAKTWVNKYRKQIESAKAHVILGVGAGYHVLCASREYPEKEFICIERVESLLTSQIYGQIKAQTNVELIVSADEKRLLKNERVQELLGSLFTIMKHQASLNVEPAYYQRILNTLAARDWRAFNSVLRFRPEEDIFLNQINFSPRNAETISPKDIINSIDSNKADLTDAEMIWKALGELIK